MYILLKIYSESNNDCKLQIKSLYEAFIASDIANWAGSNSNCLEFIV